MINRRKLLATFGLCALAAPLRALAQQPPKIWRIGFLGVRPVPPSPNPDPLYMNFLEGMHELGYAEGKNLAMTWRSSENYERLPSLAAELERLQVAVIVAAAAPCVQAAQKATATIPIVMVAVSDPVRDGYVASLGRPGGRITGVSNANVDLSAKQVELLRLAVPKMSLIAVLRNPANPSNSNILDRLQVAARSAGVRLSVHQANSTSQIDDAFKAIARERPHSMIVLADSLFIQLRRQIAELALKNRLPSIFSNRQSVADGGLMSYGVKLSEQYRRAADYVDRILKGAKPADLPVEQPMKLELVVNTKTAKALGLTIPQSLLLRADEVIE